MVDISIYFIITHTNGLNVCFLIFLLFSGAPIATITITVTDGNAGAVVSGFLWPGFYFFTIILIFTTGVIKVTVGNKTLSIY